MRELLETSLLRDVLRNLSEKAIQDLAPSV